MLAPGVLAVLQAVSSYNSSMRILEQNLAQAAQLVGQRRSQHDLRIARDSDEPCSAAGCSRAATGSRVDARCSVRSAASISMRARSSSTRQGDFTCTSSRCAASVNVADRALVSRNHERRCLRRQRPRDRAAGWVTGAWSPRCRCSTTRASSRIGRAFHRTRLADASLSSAAPSDDDAALRCSTGKGDLITADAERSPSPSPLPRKSLIDEHLQMTASNADVSSARARWHVAPVRDQSAARRPYLRDSGDPGADGDRSAGAAGRLGRD